MSETPTPTPRTDEAWDGYLVAPNMRSRYNTSVELETELTLAKRQVEELKEAYRKQFEAHDCQLHSWELRNAELVKDKERLDWLESNKATANFGTHHNWPDGATSHVWNGKDYHIQANHFYGESFRQAIDEARS